MIITQKKFEKQFQEKTLRIAFIGMSNIGKSYASEKLQEIFDFEIHSIDAEIQKDLGQKDWAQAANWMGYPFEEKYKQNEQKYLEMEEAETLRNRFSGTKNAILDTTGSAVYLSDQVHKYLKENFLIIAFDTASSMLEEMEKEFFVSPKTIVWGDKFNKLPNENNIDALRRCYPELLNHRIKKYRKLSDMIIPGEFSRYNGLTGERILEIIKLSLPRG